MSSSQEFPGNSAQQFVAELLYAGDSDAIDTEVLAFLSSWDDDDHEEEV